MCGIAGYSLRSRSTSSGRSPRRRCSPRSPNAAPTRSATPIARPDDVVRHRRQAAHAGVAAARPRLGARRGRPAAHPRPRLHEGASVDLRQQPPGAPRAGGRDPQRDHRQRRRAARRARLRARRAADDGRLRGDLRARSALAERRARARGAARLDGRGWLDEREPEVLFAARGSRPAALARQGPRRRLVRLDEATRSSWSSSYSR